jgi:hypothetical protein
MKKIEFLILLNSNERKSIIGPKLLNIYRELTPEDKEDLLELIELSPYSEIPEIIRMFGPLVEKYKYNEMRAGLWLRKYLQKKHRYFKIHCGKFKSFHVAKILYESCYLDYLPSARKELDLGLQINEKKLKQFNRWCNLVVLEPCNFYSVLAYSDQDMYSYTSNFYINIIKTDFNG